MALMTYLIRDRHRTYYFRRPIPPALRSLMPAPFTGKTAWKRSLGTKDPAVAKRAAARLMPACAADFEIAERAARGEPPAAIVVHQLAMPRPEEIEADELARLLADDEAERSDGDARRQHQSLDERAPWPDLVSAPMIEPGMAEDHHHVYGETLEELAGEYRAALSRANPKIVDAACRNYLQARGLPIVPNSDDYRAAAMAMLRAHVEAHDRMLDRQRGAVVRTPSPASFSRGPKLSEAFAEWRAGSGTRGGRKPSARTLLEAEYSVRRFTEWFGDATLGDLTREKATEFRNALARVPTRLPDNLRRLPLRDLLKRSDLAAYPPVHAATINKSLTLLAAIVMQAEAAGKLDAVSSFRNPFGKGIKLTVNARAVEGRKPFDAADLQAIFNTGVYRAGDRPVGGGGEAAFWLPVLALMSGARQGELAQLRVMDVAQEPETGIWFLDIGTAGGRSIKTASSARKVPLHPALVDMGFLRYRQSLIDGGASPAAPLWPHVEADQEGRQNGPWSKWFNRYLRTKAGIEDKAKVFHSFRHAWKDLARRAGLPEDVHDAITGHAGGGVGRGYGAGFGLEVLAREMARIETPAALEGLAWEHSTRDRKKYVRFTRRPNSARG